MGKSFYCNITLVQIPHPMHNVSDMKASFDVGITSMQSFPIKQIFSQNKSH